MLIRLFALFSLLAFGALPLSAQDTVQTVRPAQTLDNIMQRQEALRNGETVDTTRGIVDIPMEGDIGGTFVGAPGAGMWRGIRHNTADISTQMRGPAADVLIQDGGMWWLDARAGPLRFYGGLLLLGMLAILAIFYLVRGRIKIEGGRTGLTIQRFKFVERFAHWLLGGSFIILALTGLILLFGRVAIIPWLGHDAFSLFASSGKWVHNNVSWAFMLGLILVTVFWIAHNIPDKQDLQWLKVGGGLFKKGVHPPAKKFNAGQKVIFWGVVLLGISISLSGLSMLFPFEFTLFSPTFDALNTTGLPRLFGFGELNAALTPQEEMQMAQLWHSIIAFLFMALIIGHIYIGTVGMEGAFDAMGDGKVDVQWAKEHHSIWYEEAVARQKVEKS